MQLQLPNGGSTSGVGNQLSPEQLQQLQNRQAALLAAQAQMRMQQQQAAQVAQAQAQAQGAGGASQE